MADGVTAVFGVPIRLTEERWEHIITRHQELANERDRVLETVASPASVLRGQRGTLQAVARYRDRWLVVAYREINGSDGFVITAYLTTRIREERAVWRS